MSALLQDDMSEFIVFGYTRRCHYVTVPVALIGLIRKFYNLWTHRRLSKREIQRVMALSNGQAVELPLAAVTVNESELRFDLRICVEDHGGTSVWYNWIKVTLPSDVQCASGYIHGRFRDFFNGKLLSWNKFQPNQNQQFNALLLDTRLEETLKSPFSFVADILQIQYTEDSEKEMFNKAERPQICFVGHYHWDITPSALEIIQRDVAGFAGGATERELSSDTNWEFACFTMKATPESKKEYQFIMSYNRLKVFPQDAHTFMMDVTVSGKVDETEFSENKIVCIGCGIPGQVPLEWDEEVIGKASRIEMDIDIQIFALLDQDDQRIEVEIWERNGMLNP